MISFWPEERSLLKTFLRFIVKAYFMEHPSAGIVKFLRCLQMSYMLLVEWKEVNLKTSPFHLWNGFIAQIVGTNWSLSWDE